MCCKDEADECHEEEAFFWECFEFLLPFFVYENEGQYDKGGEEKAIEGDSEGWCLDGEDEDRCKGYGNNGDKEGKIGFLHDYQGLYNALDYQPF